MVAARSSRLGRVPWGVLGMLVLIGLGEAAIARLEPGLLGIEPWDWRQTGRAATGAEVRAASVLCLGDSLVKLGVQPAVLAEQLGGGEGSVYNLALCAGRAPASYFLLRRALNAGAKPTALIVDFSDTALADPPEATVRLYADLLRPDEACELAGTMRRPNHAGALLAFQASRAVRNRFEIRQAIQEAFLGHRDRAQVEALAARSVAFQEHWHANRGAQVMPPAGVLLSSNPDDWNWVQPLGWRPDPTNVAYLTALFDLARARGIAVFWLLPPLHPGLTARQVQVGSLAPFDAFVAATRARFPEVTVVDGRRLGYDASLFIDMAHLDGAGSARLTRTLGSVLAERRGHAGPQVVILEPSPVQRASFEPEPTAPLR